MYMRRLQGSTKIWQVFLAGVLSITWHVPALSQQIPKEIIGKWYRIQGTSESSLSVEVHRGKLFMANHLDGEGYECDFPSSNIHAQQVIRSGAKFGSISGNADCRAEENPVEKFAFFSFNSGQRTILRLWFSLHQRDPSSCFKGTPWTSGR